MKKKTYVLNGTTWEEVYRLNPNSALPSILTPSREYLMHLDCGRKYFTVSWIKSLIDTLSTIGYNALQLHFSEEMGFRVESKLYPWLAGSDIRLCVRQLGQTDVDEGKYLTQAEVLDICNYANNKGIEIIPSFDTPGHVNYILTKYEEHYGTSIRNYYHPRQSTIDSMGSTYTSPISNDSMDLSNDTARAFIKSLINEMALLFRQGGCTRFDIGADEVVAKGKPIPSGTTRWAEMTHWDSYAKNKFSDNDAMALDLYVDWINEISESLKEIGYTKTYIWNDIYGIERNGSTTLWNKVVTLNKDIEFLWWKDDQTSSGAMTLETAITEGFKVFNCVSAHNYYVLTPNYTQPTVNSYTEHDSTNFGTSTRNMYDSAVKGTMFCVWCDNPVGATESTIMSAITPLLTAKYARNEALPITLNSITAVLNGTYNTNNTVSDISVTTTAHYSNNTTATVTGVLDTSNVVMNTAGTYSIGVSYTEGGVTKTTTVSLTVTEAGGGESSRELVYSEDFIEADISANTNIGASTWTNISGRYYTYEFDLEITNNVGSNNSVRATNAMTNFGSFSDNVSREPIQSTFKAAGSKRTDKPFACRVGTTGNSYHVKIWNVRIYQEAEDYTPPMSLFLLEEP